MPSSTLHAPALRKLGVDAVQVKMAQLPKTWKLMKLSSPNVESQLA